MKLGWWWLDTMDKQRRILYRMIEELFVIGSMNSGFRLYKDQFGGLCKLEYGDPSLVLHHDDDDG